VQRDRPATRIGSLCTGYGGLDEGVRSVLGGELAWVADNDEGAAAILAHRFPSVKNLGDITIADWGGAGLVDVLTAGFPCQDVSCAGGRAGLREGNRTGVWAHVARAIDELRPSLVVLENVRGLLNAGADSDVESCPWCLGEAGNEHPLRALGAVLGDLADLGYDARWAVVSAAAAGAPHRRERVFIVAWPAADATNCGWHELNDGSESRTHGPASLSWRAGVAGDYRGSGLIAADAERDGLQGSRPTARTDAGRPGAASVGCGLAVSGQPAEDADRAARGERRLAAPGQAAGGRPRADAGGPGGVRAAADADRGGLPELAECDSGTLAGIDGAFRDDAERRGEAPADAYGATGRRYESRRRPGPVQGAAVAERAAQQPGRLHSGSGDPGAMAWGAYGPAIRRWEAATGRHAPPPTEPGRTGQRLSPRFVEWMMGLPEGWVTDVPGLSRNAQLKALGNGVVPQQAAMALRLLLNHVDAERAA
jgi:DNA (cytosine-5)-methyltransferase 1